MIKIFKETESLAVATPKKGNQIMVRSAENSFSPANLSFATVKTQLNQKSKNLCPVCSIHNITLITPANFWVECHYYPLVLLHLEPTTLFVASAH
jgi:hypothetical protein